MRLINRVLGITLSVASFAAAQGDPPGRVGRINYVAGAVSFQPAGVDDWVGAVLNRPLTSGDRLWVDRDGRAELHVGSAALRLGTQTSFSFTNLDDRSAQLRLDQGSLIVRVRNLDPDEVMEIDTPNVAFSLLRPGVYRVDANPDTQSTTLTVRLGEGEATGSGQAFSVKPGQQARITGDQTTTYDLAGAPPPDEFDGWCGGRDRREDQLQSVRYVPRDMTGYEDLDANGTWRTVPDYGPVWYPRAVPAGWAPYHDGHWAWVEPWGWTWVDDAPWGFAPFHYGRWAYAGGAWFWVPGPMGPAVVRPVYAPALVAWVGGPRFSIGIGVGAMAAGVAWFALGPREVFVPAYHVSETYVTRVNVTNTVVTNVNVINVYRNTTVTNVYVNRRAPNAVVAVPREAFVGGRPVAQAAVRVNEEQMRNAQVGHFAEVAPVHQSVLGHGAVAPVRPPAAALTRRVVARATPPPPPVPFAQRAQALAANPGRPVDPQTMQRLRAQQPQVSTPRPPAPAQTGQAPRSYERPATPPPSNAQAPRPTPPPSNAQAPRPTPPPSNTPPPRTYERERTPPPPANAQAPRPTPPPSNTPPPRTYERERTPPPPSDASAPPRPHTPPPANSTTPRENEKRPERGKTSKEEKKEERR
jgi:hypothetical protein